MTYEIQKNVPLPPSRRAKKYPFDTMAVGDSFFAPVMVSCLNSSAYRFRRGTTLKHTIRSVIEDGVAGCRVWRVA